MEERRMTDIYIQLYSTYFMDCTARWGTQGFRSTVGGGGALFGSVFVENWNSENFLVMNFD